MGDFLHGRVVKNEPPDVDESFSEQLRNPRENEYVL
jgi:hypothetical protein